MRRLWLVVPFLTLAGCMSNVPDVNCSNEDVPSYSDMTVWDKCVPCHSAFASYDTAAARADDAQQAVADGKMPRGQYSLTPDEEHELYVWAQCGTPP